MPKDLDIIMFPDGRLRSRDAAAYLGISPKTLATWRTRGEGPVFIKLGRIFYYKSDVDAWLSQAARVTSTAQARLSQADQPRKKKAASTQGALALKEETP